MRGLRVSSIALALALMGCASSGGKPAPGPTGGAAGLDPDLRAALEALSFSESPPPPADISNRWADDADAALFGRRLFFDPRFSGELLTGDNDGSVNARVEE